MKTVMLVVLCFLGLFSIQGSTAIESYAAYYAELVMESSDVPYITDEQKIVDLITVDLIPVTLAYLNITTECRIVGDKTNCTCKGDYIWSNDVCRSHSACCNMDYCITQTSNYTPMCTPKSRVTVIGSLTLQEIYDPDLADNSSATFQSKSIYLATSLKKTFSEFSGFDSLVITQFRRGSVIADFEMTVNVHFTSSELAMKTRAIEEYLNASIALQTIGLVIMKIPEVPVCFASEQTLSCEFKEAVDGMWTLTKETMNEIVNGSEVSITGQGSIITLHRTSDHWKGTYTCAFLADKIYHKASGDLDIALLPEIVNKFYEPQFPDCIPDDQLRLIAKITYEIENEKEHYIVRKSFQNNSTEINPTDDPDDSIMKYEVETIINCATYKEDPLVNLTFTNRLKQTLTISTTIPVIYGKLFCEKDNKWPRTKIDFKATLPCSEGSVGQIERECDASGKWKNEISYCVDEALNSLLEQALDIMKGRGSIQHHAKDVFAHMKNATSKTNQIASYANLNASVDIFSAMYVASGSANVSKPITITVLEDALHAASNLLNDNLSMAWTPENEDGTDNNLTSRYLQSVEGLAENTDITQKNSTNYENVEFSACNSECDEKVFNVSVSMKGEIEGVLKLIGFKNLASLLPNNFKDTEPSSIVLSATLENKNPRSSDISVNFQLKKDIPHDHTAYCVFWDLSLHKWSDKGCVLKKTGFKDQVICECNHLTSFSTLMSKSPVALPFLDELTYIGLGVSIVSLIICLMIEVLVWNSVVKSSVGHFRHTALINISLCLLLADCCFLASDFASAGNWCLSLVLLKHFCYLSMFFWMLCLSMMLLHKLIFVFNQVRKKVYLAFSISLGYVCPLIVVAFSYIYYDNGSPGSYYNDKSCWLNYEGTLKGSIHTFILPIGVIIFMNLFSLVVVISKLLRPSVSQGDKGDEKEMAKSILKAVVFLTPIFGITWILGFFVLIVDLSDGVIPMIVHYSFTILNSFQGLFILLTACIGEQKVREALLKHVTSASKSAKTEVSSKITSSIAKK